MQGVARGARDVVAGFRFLAAHPRLWAWVIAPALVTLVLLLAAIWGVAATASPLVAWLTGWMPDAIERWAGWLAWLVVLVALGLAALLVFVPVAGVVAGPFNELLSEAVEARLTGVAGPRFSLAALVRDALLGLLHGLRRLAVAIGGALLLFTLSFVPVVGTLGAPALALWRAARAAAYDCYDAVLARRRLSYAAKGAYLSRHRQRTFGLGATVAALLLVPGVNLVALGLGAVGATLAAHELGEP
ncbi:MAG: EI24 domain-containing protein [Kofleriaceae bacterium]|nr:EI24 domain-containing protein [Kofleriaceae bacterium]